MGFWNVAQDFSRFCLVCWPNFLGFCRIYMGFSWEMLNAMAKFPRPYKDSPGHLTTDSGKSRICIARICSRFTSSWWWYVTMFQKSAHQQPGFSAGLGLFGAGLPFVYIFHLLSAGFASFRCRFCPFRCRFCLFKCRLEAWHTIPTEMLARQIRQNLKSVKVKITNAPKNPFDL